MTAAFIFGPEVLEIRILRKFKPKKIVVYRKENSKDKTVFTYLKDSYHVKTSLRDFFIQKYMYLFEKEKGLYAVKCGTVKREYRGTLELRRSSGAKDIILILNTDIEDYIPGVIAVESEKKVGAK